MTARLARGRGLALMGLSIAARGRGVVPRVRGALGVLLDMQSTVWMSASGARQMGLYGSDNMGGEEGQETSESGDDRRYIGGLNNLATVHLADMVQDSSAYINIYYVLCLVMRFEWRVHIVCCVRCW